jgi:hypothetical protein
VPAIELVAGNNAIRWGMSVHKTVGIFAFNDGSAHITRSPALREAVFDAYHQLTSGVVHSASGKRPSNHILPPR